MAVLARLLVESARLRFLQALETELGAAGWGPVAGVDEVGRGCLAGPVTAAAYIPLPGSAVPGVDDSKRLSPAERERLAPQLRQAALAFAIASASAEEIDRLNILEASRLAMRRALRGLSIQPGTALVDATPLRGVGFRCLAVVKADALSYCVACASILAKVERDRCMEAMDATYPQYGFRANKGYAAPEHLSALRQHGPSPLHRLTFGSVLPRVRAA
jgi:ribonuclease HII